MTKKNDKNITFTKVISVLFGHCGHEYHYKIANDTTSIALISRKI